MGLKNAQLIKYGSSLAKNSKKVNLDDEYGLLDSRERDFCKDRNISSKDFYKVKQALLMEQAKNTAMSHKLLKEKGRDVAEVK